MKSPTRALFSLMSQNKRTYIVDSLIMVVANIAEALTALFFGYAIGVAINDISDYKKVAVFLFTALALNIIHMIFWHTGDYWIVKRVYKDTYKLRDLAFRKIWKFDYPEFIDKPSSKIAASITRLQENTRSLYDSMHYGFFSIIIYYLTLVVSIAAISWHNSLIYSLFILIAVFILVRPAKQLARKRANFADAIAELDGKVFDSTANYTNVFSFNAKGKEIAANKKNSARLFDSQYISERANIKFWMTASFMTRWALWSLILGTNFYLYKNGVINQAGFAASITVLTSFTGQYWSLVHHIAEFGGRFAAYRQNYEYLFEDRNIVAESVEKKQRIEKTNMERELSFKKASFAYPDAPETSVLNDLNLSITKNEKVGVVGRSGGGKSTLIKLLLGFYEPTVGSIEVDGEQVSKEELGRLISYVPQDTTLFQETIAYNISYAVDHTVTLAEVVAAAKKAHAHDFIIKLKDGYDTLVGERGVKLSLGQRQRIALARAFLKNSDILILDEATSSLDSKTEKKIQDSLEKLWRHKTVIAIAHRLSTLNNVDRIIVIENGKIAESGTKTQLLKKKGVFADLWKHQKDGLI